MCKDLTPHQKQKKKKGLCVTPFCTKRRAHNRNTCHSCNQRAYAQRRPVEYAYSNLRANARRRGKEFSLTLDQFREFAARTFYMDKRGKHHNGLHIDRIDESRGYHADNIQPLPNHENVSKSNKFRASRKALSEAPF